MGKTITEDQLWVAQTGILGLTEIAGGQLQEASLFMFKQSGEAEENWAGIVTNDPYKWAGHLKWYKNLLILTWRKFMMKDLVEKSGSVKMACGCL